MILIQLAIVLICIFIGARMSGIGLGVMGMIGLLLLIFIFKMQPADPPLEVMLIILSVVTAAAALQAAGGMDCLVIIAGKLLRSRPKQITILGPLVTYFFTLFAGTAHISYSIMPIIAEIAIKKRIRPERALSMSVIAAHMGITASPVSAATAALLTVVSASGIKLGDILKVCIPSTIIGVLVGILFVYTSGKRTRCGSGISGKDEGSGYSQKIWTRLKIKTTTSPLKPGAIKSVIIFGLAVLVCCFGRILPCSASNVLRRKKVSIQALQ